MSRFDPDGISCYDLITLFDFLPHPLTFNWIEFYLQKHFMNRHNLVRFCNFLLRFFFYITEATYVRDRSRCFFLLGMKPSKVRTFWEAHIIWKNLPSAFDKSADLLSRRQNHEEDFFKLCVLLKKSELYLHHTVRNKNIFCFIHIFRHRIIFLFIFEGRLWRSRLWRRSRGRRYWQFEYLNGKIYLAFIS